MTHEKVIEALQLYAETLQEKGWRPRCRNDSDWHMRDMDHVCWMCEEAQNHVRDGRIEKAMRWLGFIQGALWMAGIFTIDEMKAHNKP